MTYNYVILEKHRKRTSKKDVKLWRHLKKKRKRKTDTGTHYKCGLYVSQTDGKHHRGKGPHRREVSDSTPTQERSIIHTHMLGAQEQTQKTYNCQHANSPTQTQSIKEKCQRASRAFTLSPSAERTIRGHKKLKIRTEWTSMLVPLLFLQVQVA